MRSENVLVTGATGAFGKYIFEELLKSEHRLVALVRGANDMEARKRLEERLNKKLDKSRVDVLASDLQKPDLGLKKSDYLRLKGSVFSIIHGAASTRFDLSLSAARNSNVSTTQNVINFVKDCQQLAKFTYISTAFVAGKRSGLILENELDETADFVNTYDQTKFEAEKLVRASMPSLPTIILRPSLVVAADSNDHHAAIFVLDLVRQGLLTFLPGVPNDPVDLIAASEAARAVIDLVEDFKAGNTYHVASGQNAPKLSDIIAITQNPKAPVKYTGYNPEDYDDLVKKFVRTNPKLHTLYEKIDCFIKYLCYPKRLDTTNTVDLLGQPLSKESTINILKERFGNDRKDAR